MDPEFKSHSITPVLQDFGQLSGFLGHSMDMPRGCLLTDIDRQIIARGIKEQKSHRFIARQIGRSQSVVSREVARNTTPRGYIVAVAKQLTQKRAAHMKPRILDKDSVLRTFVVFWIREGLSPEEVVGRLRMRPTPALRGHSVSHETIYDWIYHGEGRYEGLIPYLRRKQTRRRKRGRGTKPPSIRIEHRLSIHQRPKRINERREVGHWEDDSMVFPGQAPCLANQYERKLMLARITKVPNKEAVSHEWALRAKIEKDPRWLWKTTTRDNGTENVLHENTRKQYGVKSYFCDTYSSWQKGGVENLNGLIREYFPRDTDMSMITPEHVAWVENKLNNRPRKKLNYLTPNEALAASLKRRKVMH